VFFLVDGAWLEGFGLTGPVASTLAASGARG
jgi:hypothetical protein